MNTDDIKKQLAKLRRDKRLLWLGVLFFVMVVFWILASIFATSKTSSVSAELRELAKPFVPRLESKVFEEILIKKIFSEEELSFFPIFIFNKKNVDGVLPVIDITAPLPESAISSEIQIEIASDSATQASESSNQSSESAVSADQIPN